MFLMNLTSSHKRGKCWSLQTIFDQSAGRGKDQSAGCWSIIIAPKGLLHRESQNFDVRRSVLTCCSLLTYTFFGPFLGPRKLQNCFEGSILTVQKRFQSVTSAKLLWRKHICDQKGDLFWWDLHLVELTCMTRRHTDRRTSKFWGSLCKSPFGATLPCRCNLVLSS